FKGFSGRAAIASEVRLRTQQAPAFTILRPGLLDARLGANITLRELARANALPPALHSVRDNPALFAALAGREVKAVVNDARAMGRLDAPAAAALRALTALRATGRNVRHAVKGRSNGQFQYLLKNGLSQLRLNSALAAGEVVRVAVNDLGTHSGVVECTPAVA